MPSQYTRYIYYNEHQYNINDPLCVIDILVYDDTLDVFLSLFDDNLEQLLIKDIKIPNNISKELTILSILDTLCKKYTPVFFIKKDFTNLTYNSIGYGKIPSNCIGYLENNNGNIKFTFSKFDKNPFNNPTSL